MCSRQLPIGRTWSVAGSRPSQLTSSPTLQGIPIVILVTEASYHASYDHCTSKYLTQAGVEHTFIRLEDAGIHGNGHMLMLEKDNLEIAQVILNWLGEHVEQGAKVAKH